MKMELSSQDMQKVYELSTKLWEARRAGMPVRDDLIEALRGEMPEKEDCEETIDSLLAGGSLLDSNLDKLNNEKLEDVLAGLLDSKLKDMQTQEQYNWLSDVLNGCLQSVGRQMSELDYYFVPAENASATDVENLKHQLLQAVSTAGLAMIENMDSANLMNQFSFTAEEQKVMKDSAVDEALDEYLELALYILYEQGEIEALRCLSGKANPKTLGVMFRGALKIAKAKMDALLGRISWEEVLLVLNRVASVLFLVLGICLSGVLITGLAAIGLTSLAALLETVLGVSILGVAAYHIYHFVKAIQNGTVEEKLNEYWDRAVQMAEQSVEWAKTFGAWMKEKLLAAWQALKAQLDQLRGRLEYAAEQENSNVADPIELCIEDEFVEVKA